MVTSRRGCLVVSWHRRRSRIWGHRVHKENEASVARLSVVVIDDSPTILGLFELVIMPPDDGVFDLVATIANATESLAACDKHNPDVVILDYEMPGVDGLTLIGQIRERHPDTVVFLMSGHDDSFGILHKEAVVRGATEFVPKPSVDDNPQFVRHLILNYLERANKLPERFRPKSGALEST